MAHAESQLDFTELGPEFMSLVSYLFFSLFLIISHKNAVQ